MGLPCFVSFLFLFLFCFCRCCCCCLLFFLKFFFVFVWFWVFFSWLILQVWFKGVPTEDMDRLLSLQSWCQYIYYIVKKKYKRGRGSQCLFSPGKRSRIFKPWQKRSNHNFSFSLGGQLLTQTNATKFLGVYIDEHLTWKDHSSCLCKQIYK